MRKFLIGIELLIVGVELTIRRFWPVLLAAFIIGLWVGRTLTVK